jgi:quercetin dioxygenase-like cupin family protein
MIIKKVNIALYKTVKFTRLSTEKQIAKSNHNRNDNNNNTYIGRDNEEADNFSISKKQDMKRNRFISTILAAGFAPLAFGTQNQKNSPRSERGFKINAGEGRIHGHIKLKGVNSNILDLKVSGKDTSGELAIFEQTSVSQGRGTPLHVHHFQDEVFFVIEGEYYFQVGGEKFSLKAGDSIFLPRKVPHAWTQVSEKGKMTVTFQPAGKMEEFFVTMAALENEPTTEEIAKTFAENEMQIVGPPLKLI